MSCFHYSHTHNHFLTTGCFSVAFKCVSVFVTVPLPDTTRHTQVKEEVGLAHMLGGFSPRSAVYKRNLMEQSCLVPEGQEAERGQNQRGRGKRQKTQSYISASFADASSNVPHQSPEHTSEPVQVTAPPTTAVPVWSPYFTCTHWSFSLNLDLKVLSKGRPSVYIPLQIIVIFQLNTWLPLKPLA